MDYIANTGLSRIKIRKFASLIRDLFEIKTIYIDAIKLLEKTVSKFDDIVSYEIVEDSELDYDVPAACNFTEDDCYVIYIKESTYIGAINGKGDCRGFIIHELCHFYLMYILGIKPIPELARSFTNKNPAYLSCEWQAKALCGELMIPYEKCNTKTFKQIQHYTGSSREQIEFFLNKVKNKGGDK